MCFFPGLFVSLFFYWLFGFITWIVVDIVTGLWDLYYFGAFFCPLFFCCSFFFFGSIRSQDNYHFGNSLRPNTCAPMDTKMGPRIGSMDHSAPIWHHHWNQGAHHWDPLRSIVSTCGITKTSPRILFFRRNYLEEIEDITTPTKWN